MISQKNALYMLYNQLLVLGKYLQDVNSSKISGDLQILRDISEFMARLSRQRMNSTAEHLLYEEDNILMMNMWSLEFKTVQMINSVSLI